MHLQDVILKTHLEVQGFCTVRWLSRGDAVNRFCDVLPVLMWMWTKEKDGMEKLATSFKFHYMLYLLADVLQLLNGLNLAFQKQTVDITEVKNHVDKVKTKLSQYYVEPSASYGPNTSRLNKFLAAHGSKDKRKMELKGVGGDGKPAKAEIELHEDIIDPENPGGGCDLEACVDLARRFAQRLIKALGKRMADLRHFDGVGFFTPDKYPFRAGEQDTWLQHHLTELLDMFKNQLPALSVPRLRPRPCLLPPCAALISLHSARPVLAGSQQRKDIRRRTLHSPHSPTPSPLFPTLSPLSALLHPIPSIPSLSSLPCIPPSHSLSHPFHPSPSAPAAPSLTPAALRTPPGAGRCDAGGDAVPDVSSMCDVSLLHCRWRREGEQVGDVWRGGGVVVREAERESGGAGSDGDDDGSNGASSSGDCCERHGDSDADSDADSHGGDSGGSAGRDGGAGGARDWEDVLTARKLLNPTQVITRIAPLLSRPSSFPLPPTAAAAAAAAANSPAGTAGTPMPAGTAAATAAGAVDSIESLEARCLALRLIGCLAPLAADVAHVQELVVRAAMEAEGQQEPPVLPSLVSRFPPLPQPGPSLSTLPCLTPSSITLSSLLASRPLPFLPSHPNLHAAILHSKSSLSLPLHPSFPLQLSSHPNLHAALLAATFLRVVSAPFILNPPSFPPFYVSFPFIPLSLLPILLSLVFLPLSPNSPTLSSIQLSSFSSSSPPSLYCSTTLPPNPPSPYTRTPHPPLQQRHAALFALTFLCDVSPPFALHTLPLLLSLALPASPPPPLPLCLTRHLHRFSHLPLPQHTKQPGVKRNVLMSQAEADEHMAVKLQQQQQQSDRFPAAQASVQPHSVHPQLFHHSLFPQALPPLALHMTPLTNSSLLPRVSRPLVRWRGDEEGEEGVRVRVAAVVVKCLAGHEETAVRRVAWQVRVGSGGNGGGEGW
ncbi:unnamed protein product [Closterium sp. Naga37s-1]|nr:unnamed protein product [Closterium sp. Naga37s-1]